METAEVVLVVDLPPGKHEVWVTAPDGTLAIYDTGVPICVQSGDTIKIKPKTSDGILPHALRI